MECHGTLWKVIEGCGMLWKVMECSWNSRIRSEEKVIEMVEIDGMLWNMDIMGNRTRYNRIEYIRIQ